MKKNICIEISFQHCGGKVSVNDISNVYFVNTRKFLQPTVGISVIATAILVVMIPSDVSHFLETTE
jgi:hypothetical protein